MEPITAISDPLTARDSGESFCGFLPRESTPEEGVSAWEPPEGYSSVRRLGVGAMGVVLEAVQNATGRRVAIKVLRASTAGLSGMSRRFAREVELLARLDHAGIVRPLDAGRTRSGAYFIMELVEGQPLDRAITPGRAPVGRVLELIAEVAEALQHAHERGVVHRDIKPDNILVTREGKIKVLDFGMGRAMTPTASEARLTLHGARGFVGTLTYMPPEQAAGRAGEIGPASDIYSLGAVAYLLLTGRTPIDTAGPLLEALNSIAHRVVEKPSALRRGLTVGVDAVLLRALAKAPGHRYGSAGEFAADLRRAAAGHPVSAPPPSRERPASRRKRSHARRRIMGSLAAAALACASTGWAFFERARTQAVLAALSERDITGTPPITRPESPVYTW